MFNLIAAFKVSSGDRSRLHNTLLILRYAVLQLHSRYMQVVLAMIA